MMPVLPPVEDAPGWNEGRVVARDCGLAGPGPCWIEAPEPALAFSSGL